MVPKYIVLHHSLTRDSGTVSWQAIRRYHMDKSWSDIGYHYGLEIVNDRYEILLGRMGDQRGAHCIGLNQKSLGIMFCGDYTHRSPPPELWSLGIKLVKYLIAIHDIPVRNVLGHREWDQDRTCPGRTFDLGRFKTDLLLNGI
jgi:hypothetical protein